MDGGREDSFRGTDDAGEGTDTEANPAATDQACVAAGGGFGVLSSRSLSGALADAGAGAHGFAPGLVVGPSGLWLTVATEDGPDDPEPRTYAIQVGFDGAVIGSPQLALGDWNGGLWWPGSGAVVVSDCNDNRPRWNFLDAEGQQLTPSATPDDGSPALGCFQPPSAAWVSDSSALIAWLDTDRHCHGGSTCARVTRASPTAHGPISALFDAGDPGSGPTVSVAAGAVSAMLAMVRIDERVELITQPLDHDGQPTATMTALVLPPSPEPYDSPDFFEARVVANDDGTFFVFVGGWGFSMGRTHITANGEVLEPLHALPPIVEIPVSAVYNSQLSGIHRRPQGWLGLGRATWGGASFTLASALNPAGDLVGQVVLTHLAAATATDGRRLWILGTGNGTSLYELGCVLP